MMKQMYLEMENKIIKVYATWCSSCKYIDKLLKDNNIEYTNIDIDTTEGENLQEEYNIVKLPTLLVFTEDNVLTTKIDEVEDIEEYIKTIK